MSTQELEIGTAAGRAGVVAATKTAVPGSPPGFVCRERLLDRLDQAVRRPLALVSAPAGAGKTALVSGWAATDRPPGPVAWFTLDEGDRDRRRFWRGVVAAVARSGAGDRVRGLAVPPRGSVDVVLPAFVTALGGHAEPVVLVLDDLQSGFSPGVLADLDLLVSRATPALRVVAVSRTDPPLRLARRRLAGELADLRESDLAASLDEAGTVLDHGGVRLDPGDVTRLWRRTEGWMAGLGLAAIGLGGHPDPHGFVTAFTGADGAVSEYLLTEVLEREDPDVREFLLATSVVDAFDVEIAEALSGRADAAAVLAELERRHAFVAPLGHDYRYHPLFAEFLRAHLRREPPARARALHRRAARHLVGVGRDLDALRHARAAADDGLIADLLAARWPALLLAGEADAAHVLWCRRPRGPLRERPDAAVGSALLELAAGHDSAAETDLAIARSASAAASADAEPRLSVALAVFDLYRARRRGDVAAALRAAATVSGTGPIGWGDEIAADLQLLAAQHLGVVQVWSGALATGRAQLEGALAIARRDGHEFQILSCTAQLAVADVIAGRLPRCAERAADVVALGEARGWEQTTPVVAAKAALGAVRYHWNDLAGATAVLDEVAPLVPGVREPVVRGLFAVSRARVLAATGDVDGALALLWPVAEELGTWPAFEALRHLVVAEQGRLLAARGDVSDAVELLGVHLAAAPNVQVATALARLRLAEGDPVGARRLVDPYLSMPSSVSSTVEAWVLAAVAEEQRGDAAAADAAVEAALDAAEAGGFRRPFTAYGEAVARLLARRQRLGTAHRALLDAVLDDFADVADVAGVPLRSRPHLIEALSPREQEVLRYLPTMRSTAEIAADLFVTLNTLKTHLKSIYRKLSVDGRRDAVRRARDLGLLGPAGRDAG